MARRNGQPDLTSTTMRLPRPFIKLPFTFDHARLAEEALQFDETEWRPHPQQFEGNSSLALVSTHGGENDDFSGPMKPTPRLASMPYLRQVMGSFNSVVGRSRLMRLAPGASVLRHVDGNYFWRHHLRIHVPIITDSDVTFYCDSEEVNMAAGESWTFDNWLPHWVENRSERSRIHLVIDTVGTADLWKMIDGREYVPRHVEFAPQDATDLCFENFPGLPVMPPAELRADLQQLLDDVADGNDAGSALKRRLWARTTDFLNDWHSHWMAHGPTPDGFPGYKSLLEGFSRDIGLLPNDLLVTSNQEPFKRAVTYTLDASLAADKFPEATGNSETAETPLARGPRFDRPVFIVAAPRSGSTLLFETLALNRELWSVGDESHKHFESIAPLRPSSRNFSNRLTADMATKDIVATLMDFFIADLVNSDGKPLNQLPTLARPAEVRLLEKTPKNALRIPFIVRAFPDARFIFLFRDAKQNISSLLDSWRSRRFVTYPGLPGWPAEMPWSHLLIPGWEQLRHRSLAEIVTQQWLVTNQIILDDLAQLPQEQWCAVEYDSFLTNTAKELGHLCRFSHVIFGPRMREVASRPLRPSKYTLTQPHPDKWKKNAMELEAILPSTVDMMATLRGLL
jgi:hypothetical protein